MKKGVGYRTRSWVLMANLPFIPGLGGLMPLRQWHVSRILKEVTGWAIRYLEESREASLAGM